MFVVHEKSKNDRFHTHSIIDKPVWFCEEKFIGLISKLFEQTNFGYKYHWYDKPSTKDDHIGWVGYMLKETDKKSKLGWVNWDCCYLDKQ